MTVGIVMTFYSQSYFYNNLPTSDAHFYRGLNEYFLNTGNLDSSIPGKSYLQWPSIFVFTEIGTSISGLGYGAFAFIMYALLGFVLITVLYILAIESFKKSGFIAVISFFIVMFFYLNYQFAAFTIAFIFVLLLFILDIKRWTTSTILLMMLLVFAITLTHEYALVFYVLFLVIRSIIKKSKGYLVFSMLTITIYLLYQITFAQEAFYNIIFKVIRSPSEVSSIATVWAVSSIVDIIAHQLVIIILATTVAISLLGFVFLLFKRKTRNISKALTIFIVGSLYTGIGMILYILGTRAIPIAFISIALGVSYLFESKFKRYIKILFLILLILFVSVPIRASYGNQFIFFQTEESYTAENFLINQYDWAKHDSFLADNWVTDYLVNRIIGNSSFTDHPEKIGTVDTVFYTIGLILTMDNENYTLDGTISGERLNVIYNNGYSLIAVK